VTPERARELNSVTSGRLTAEEMRQGWHFCYDWDGLLVNANHKGGEAASCTCGSWLEDQIARALAAGEKEGPN
jgi:DNA-binding transcriptional regulator YdaS (Cro superfamily)